MGVGVKVEVGVGVRVGVKVIVGEFVPVGVRVGVLVGVWVGVKVSGSITPITVLEVIWLTPLAEIYAVLLTEPELVALTVTGKQYSMGVGVPERLMEGMVK